MLNSDYLIWGIPYAGCANLLDDPLGSGQSINLIHMIASIDGIYESTGYSPLGVGFMQEERNHQRDLVSWLGDLQSLAGQMISFRTINNLHDYTPALGHIDFNNYINADLAFDKNF